MTEINQDTLKVSSLREHPEVGGESEVSGDDVENPAGNAVPRPNLTVIQNKVVPENPGYTAKCVREEEILVNGNSVTGETFEEVEDHERANQKKQRDANSKYC